LGVRRRMNIIMMDIRRAKTPPSLFGIARKIAYANKKYHSGWMWVGVTSGFAGIKLSGSIREKGFCRLNSIKRNTNKIRLVISLVRKYG